MSPQTIKIIIVAILFLHGLAHGRAFIALIGYAAKRGEGSALPVRSWLFPSAAPQANAVVAGIFWLLSTIGFIAAALSLWGTPAPGETAGETWRQLAIASSIISTIGILLFSGRWPGAPDRRYSILDTLIALVVNLAVLVCLLWLRWPI